MKFSQAVDVEKAPLVFQTCESNAVLKGRSALDMSSVRE
jgi:hypothetical protein